MFKNAIAIRIEDLHGNAIVIAGQHNFSNYRAAELHAEKLNNYYSDECIPRIASVVVA